MTCTAIKMDGTNCTAMALDSGLCFAHDPQNRERATAARRRGGTNRSNVARASRRMPRDLADLSKRLLEAFSEVHSGELAPDKAHAMSRIAAVFVQLHSAVEVDARIDALETAATGGKGTLASLVNTYRRPGS
jgi:hypothetical protein